MKKTKIVTFDNYEIIDSVKLNNVEFKFLPSIDLKYGFNENNECVATVPQLDLILSDTNIENIKKFINIELLKNTKILTDQSLYKEDKFIELFGELVVEYEKLYLENIELKASIHVSEAYKVAFDITAKEHGIKPRFNTQEKSNFNLPPSQSFDASSYYTEKPVLPSSNIKVIESQEDADKLIYETQKRNAERALSRLKQGTDYEGQEDFSDIKNNISNIFR